MFKSIVLRYQQMPVYKFKLKMQKVTSLCKLSFSFERSLYCSSIAGNRYDNSHLLNDFTSTFASVIDQNDSTLSKVRALKTFEVILHVLNHEENEIIPNYYRLHQ